MTHSIRPLEKSDRARWLELFQAYLAFYDTELQPDRLDHVWRWIFDPDNNFWCDLAIDAQGQAVGLAHYQLMHNSLLGSMTCYLADLFVDPSTRGAGVGRLLLDHVQAVAKAKGLPAVDLLTDETNERGRSLYDSYKEKTDYVFYSLPVSGSTNDPV